MFSHESLSPVVRTHEVVHENDFYHIRRVEVDFGDFTKNYYISEHGQRVGMVVSKGDDVLLVRQYRFLLNSLSWEIPGGGVREGEALEEAAVRECREETGIVCRNIRPLMQFHQGLDAVHNLTHIFYTKEFTETNVKDSDPKESTEHHWVPINQCVEMIFSRKIADSFSISSLLAFRNISLESQTT